MTSLSFQKSDEQKIIDNMTLILRRRRALVPWPLAVDDMIDVQHLPRLAATIRDLRDNHPHALWWDGRAMLVVDAEPRAMMVELVASVELPLSIAMPITHGHNRINCADTEATERLRHWAWEAQRIELENRWAMHIIKRLTENATTHQQVHRYMPEIYTLLGHHYENPPTKSNPGRSIPEVRMAEVIKELRATGSTRATKMVLEGISLTDRNNLKMLLAQTLLLRPQVGLGVGTVFEHTWISV